MYALFFHDLALKEWRKLDSSIRDQFTKKLLERLDCPRVEKDRVRGVADAYKIKLRTAGYRLVYTVHDETVRVYVIVVGKREKSAVYKAMKGRTQKAGSS